MVDILRFFDSQNLNAIMFLLQMGAAVPTEVASSMVPDVTIPANEILQLFDIEEP